MGKPKIDIASPLIAAGIRQYKEQATKAFEQAKKMDNAVRPVYALDERTQLVEQAGSGVLLAVADELFLLSASHVFDAIGAYQLLIGFGSQLMSFKGDRFSTIHGPSGTHSDDKIDASVFHITDSAPNNLYASALRLSDLDIAIAPRAPEFYVASGYRVSQSKSTSKGHSTWLDRYPTMELDAGHYKHYKLDREWQLALAFEDDFLVDGRWQKSPSIRGFSGGAMFRVSGLSPLSRSDANTVYKLKLAAILIERRKGVRNKTHSVAVGTRLGVHFALIDKYLPELNFQQRLAEAHAEQVQS